MIINDTHNSILIVDDQPQNLQVIATVLREKYHIFIANNGKKAIKIAQEKQPDLILLDVMMPEMSGFEVCKELKSMRYTKDIPVIFLTARTEKEDIIKGLELGGVDYITKPFNQQEVVTRIKTHIDLKNASNTLTEQNKLLVELNKKLALSQEELEKRNDDLIIAQDAVEEHAFQVNTMNIKLMESEEKLKNLNQELNELNASKDKFFSIIAHDLRNPFTSLLCLSEMLKDEIASFSVDELQSMATNFYNAVQRLYKLLENLLEWARIQQGKIENQPEEFNILSLAKQSVGVHATTAAQKEINLYVTSLGISEDDTAYADMKIIDTILRNLISNAIKFTQRGGTVEVTVSKYDGDSFLIAVKDDGVGISEENLKHLFAIDSKISTRGTEGEPSTGLGLILCKELIEKSKGILWAESLPDEGSEFSFTVAKFKKEISE